MATTIHANGLLTVEHEFEVPVDHEAPDGRRLTVFAREVAEPDGGDKPFLVFLQGGPGSEAPRPTRNPTGPGWLGRALRDFRVLMLDQRGTGRSTPVGPDLPGTAAEQAAYLAHFRADAIVRDAEWIRRALGVERWSVLGQSFGGFCGLTYLSFAPDGLREVLITGGVPPLEHGPDEFYALTYALIAARAGEHFRRFPGDAERLRDLHTRVVAGELPLTGGERLSAGRLRMLGSALGMSDGSASLHHRLELPPGSPAFRHDLQDPAGFGRNPLYALLNEASLADGVATQWASARLEDTDSDPLRLTGEHVFPWLFEELHELRPLGEAADLLAEREWERLYDPAQLARNTVPAAAIVYADDPYVPRRFSEETAERVRGLRPWVTNEYLHNGLRADGARILDRLLDLARGRA